tara:strand:+ start:1780 stop:2160 length:381 start_codon:yes stop_codon:yes gene_type:complete
MNHFDYLNSINDTKKDIMVDDLAEKDYNAFMVNRGLSYYNDTVIYANEMNKYAQVDSRMQYDFLKQIVRKRKRFSKWNKADKSADIEVIKEYYGYSRDKAYQVLSILTKDQLDVIRKKISKGGRSR